MPKLTAVIIAKDEERDLPGCLESISGLCDELVVVIDEKSDAATEEIARRAGAKVRRRAFDGYAGQKQAALEMATGDWVLSIDCDERATPELKAEIARVIAAPPGFAAYDIPFQFWFLGKHLRFGGMGHESHLRLFRRAEGKFTGGLVHEGIEVSGPVGRLTGAMRHYSYRDLSDYLGKLETYTTLGARKRFDDGKRFRVWHHLILPWEFFARAVLKLGILDGSVGVIWAGLCAVHSWVKYLKLREFEEKAGA